jgi:hypothetical protein
VNGQERAVAYRIALEGRGRDIEVALAEICVRLPSGLSAAETWEGALLAEVTPERLHRAVTAGWWPSLAALADLAGEDPWSRAVRVSRLLWSR